MITRSSGSRILGADGVFPATQPKKRNRTAAQEEARLSPSTHLISSSPPQTPDAKRTASVYNNIKAPTSGSSALPSDENTPLSNAWMTSYAPENWVFSRNLPENPLFSVQLEALKKTLAQAFPNDDRPEAPLASQYSMRALRNALPPVSPIATRAPPNSQTTAPSPDFDTPRPLHSYLSDLSPDSVQKVQVDERGSPIIFRPLTSLNPMCTPILPKHLAYNKPTPFTIKANAAREGKTICNANNQIFTKILLPNAGEHCVIGLLDEGQPLSFIPGLDNKSILLKYFKAETIRSNGLDLETGLIRRAREQYKRLEAYFQDKNPAEKPYTTLYNVDSIPGDGYIAAEKVQIFAHPLWEKDSLVNELPPDHRRVLDQIKNLFHYSFLDASAPGLDLKWANIGIRPGTDTVVLCDFFEYEDQFYISAQTFLENLSRKSPSIYHYILNGLQEKVLTAIQNKESEDLSNALDKLISMKAKTVF